MECNKGFSSCYMILKPEKVKFLDLFRILFSTNIADKKFVESARANEDSLDRRWLIFVSVLTQKFFNFSSKPLAFVGSLIEMWLNLLSSNRNIGRLFINLLKGKVVVPEKSSSAFLSFVGHIDKRVELDKSISRGDARYLAALSMMASKVSYENNEYIKKAVTSHWKMELLVAGNFWNAYQGKASTQAFILRDNAEEHDTIVVAFRGTELFNSDDLCTDVDISWYELPGVGKIHSGFMKALGLQKNLGWPKELKQEEISSGTNHPTAYYSIRDMLREILTKNPRTKYVLTGHSLGGALASLFPAILALHEEKLLLERLDGVYTFGQPRVGDDKFGEFMEEKLRENGVKYYRFVYGNDMIPRLPYDDAALMFKHFGTCIHFNRHYHGKVVEEEPNKNYFSPFGVIHMIGTAFFELIRSFTISRTRGPDYKESWLLRAFRVMGLANPGLPAHTPQDYVNSTRLMSEELVKQLRETTAQAMV